MTQLFDVTMQSISQRVKFAGVKQWRCHNSYFKRSVGIVSHANLKILSSRCCLSVIRVPLVIWYDFQFIWWAFLFRNFRYSSLRNVLHYKAPKIRSIWNYTWRCYLKLILIRVPVTGVLCPVRWDFFYQYEPLDIFLTCFIQMRNNFWTSSFLHSHKQGT